MDAPQRYLQALIGTSDGVSASGLRLKLDKGPAMLKWFEDQMDRHYATRSAVRDAGADGAALRPSLLISIPRRYIYSILRPSH